MTKNNTEIQLNCYLIEAMVKQLVVNGITDYKVLVKQVDSIFAPENKEEMEAYSEAIIYAKQSLLN
jgi:hypothetical protein